MVHIVAAAQQWRRHDFRMQLMNQHSERRQRRCRPRNQPTHCPLGCDRLWPDRLGPSLSDRLWPNRLWPNRLWPTLIDGLRPKNGWPTLARPTLAKTSVSVFGPRKNNKKKNGKKRQKRRTKTAANRTTGAGQTMKSVFFGENVAGRRPATFSQNITFSGFRVLGF